MTDNNTSKDAGANPSLYPIAVLIDELRCEDQKKRLNSIASFHTICIALGPTRCKEELLPFILELLEDDEEILSKLAEVLGSCLEYVGGPSQADHLFRVLERLSGIEEVSVREKTTESIQKILGQIRIKDYESSLLQMLHRLNNNDAQTSRYTCVHLIPTVYPFFQPQNQAELLEIFNKISQDSSNQIRKQAIIVLNKLIKLIPKVPEAELLALYGRVCKDEQDSVRMHAIECSVSFSAALSPAKFFSQLNPLIKQLSKDKSWRIRYMLADQIVELAKAIGNDATKDLLLPIFAAFLKDSEAEVKTAALNKLAEFVQHLSAGDIVSMIVPSFAELQKESTLYVRSALSEHMLSVCPIIGKGPATKPILEVFLLLLRDENSEVSLNLFKRLEDLNKVVGVDELQTPLIEQLNVLSKEKNWRLKIQLIGQFPMLAKQLGEPFFNDKLNSFCQTWLKDSIFSVRESALQNYRDLTKVFGEQWALKHFLPHLFALQTEISYLHRLTILFGMQALSEVVSMDTLKRQLMPMIVTLHQDPVANVRLNVARSLLFFQDKIKQSKDIQDQTRQMLKTLQKDTDIDVKYFAEKSLRALC